MPALYIRDEEVSDLAEKLRAATQAPSKTVAVKRALEQALAGLESVKSIDELLAPAFAAADKIGPANPSFDYKSFKNDLSEA